MILLQENCDHPRTYPMQILIQNLLPFNKLQNELPLLITFPSSTYARLCLLNRLNNGKLLLIDNQNKKRKRDISMVGQCLVWPFSIYLPCGNRLPPATLKFIHFYCNTCQCPSSTTTNNNPLLQWNPKFSVTTTMATASVTLISLPGLKTCPRTLVLFRLRHCARF